MAAQEGSILWSSLSESIKVGSHWKAVSRRNDLFRVTRLMISNGDASVTQHC